MGRDARADVCLGVAGGPLGSCRVPSWLRSLGLAGVRAGLFLNHKISTSDKSQRPSPRAGADRLVHGGGAQGTCIMTCDRRTYATCARKTDGRVGMHRRTGNGQSDMSDMDMYHMHRSHSQSLSRTPTVTPMDAAADGRCRATTPTLDLSSMLHGLSMLSRCYLDASA